MIKSEDQSVYDDIKEILLDEYVDLLKIFKTFTRNNQLEEAFAIKITMDEVDNISCKLLGYDISLFALKHFQ